MSDVEKSRRARAFLGLGSNLGAREQNLRVAVRLLSDAGDIEIVKVSSIYESEPVGYNDQPDFLNLAAEVATTLDPHALLRLCLQVEDEMGRVREERWGPRVFDVDVLLYEDMVVSDEELVLPHPEMLKRAFVLVPLLELAPDLEMPDGRRVADALQALSEEDQAGVVRLKDWEVPVPPKPVKSPKVLLGLIVATVAGCILAIILVVALVDRSPRIKQMVIETGRGNIVIEMKDADAPQTCRHIEAMVKNGSYQGVSFFQVDEIAAMTGITARDYGQATINARGAVGMAKPSDPRTGTPLADSATNEFYILKQDTPSLDPNFTIFGHVSEGLDVVDALTMGTAINSISLDSSGRYMTMEQDTGTIVIELDREGTPRTVQQITDLINSGFYSGMNWYRVEDFVVQTGSHARSLQQAGADAATVQRGQEQDDGVSTVVDEIEYTVPVRDPAMLAEEAKTVPMEGKLPAVRGAMVLYWQPQQLQSQTQSYFPQYPTEFLIMKQDYSEQIGTNFTIFGQVVEGMDVVDNLQSGDTITGIYIREVKKGR